ncbi:hypothetical protein AYO40_05400 [Planctomycetaceae bacterium SCGC AG-212-D15]|nr:hypothetical protein AYO40_05400 [Planctomycetaceae bacterium SCGC AG-212-D15]
MPAGPPSPRLEARLCRTLAGLLILAWGAVHVLYLLRGCGLDLSPDEAHYWLWSRNLDWSYYSKGPGVAYLIRLGTELAGGLSLQWTGNLVMAVRLPAVVCGCLLLVSLYVLTIQVYRRERLALGVVALALTLPIVSVGSTLITIDSPYTCCWGCALVAGYHAAVRRVAWAWPVAGLLVGLGILAKYTMVVWLPSLGLFLLFDRERRQLLLQTGFWVMIAVAGFCCLPILIWNAQHDWVTFRHVFVQAGSEAKGITWMGPLRFLGAQLGILIFYWFVVWTWAMYARRPWKNTARTTEHGEVARDASGGLGNPPYGEESQAGIQYLWWMSAPMFLMFFVFSLRTNGGEPNWAVTAYISGLVLSAGWLVEQMGASNIGWRRFSYAGVGLACLAGVALTLLVHFSTAAQPVLAWVSGPPTEQHPLPLRRFDPTCRLRGWHYLAEQVDCIREMLAQEGIEPIISANSWMVPGELAFYCQGQPATFSIGLGLGDRWSQFDLWHPNPVLDPEDFEGRTFIFIGGVCPKLRDAFAGQDFTVYPIVYEERGQPIARWTIVVCRGFKSLTPQSRAAR